jgi:aminocyclitol acetyltransferase
MKRKTRKEQILEYYAGAEIPDYIDLDSDSDELPFEWTCHGVSVGRQTYFGDGFVSACEDGDVESIGHFTSINGSADIGRNHQLNMVFTSDDIVRHFNAENAAKFNALLDADPAHPYARNKPKITIGSDVYIGANVFINSSRVSSIGHGAIIGTGAVVLHDVPPFAVVVGAPAKIIRYRFSPEMIETLLRVQWWHWDDNTLNANADALFAPELFMERFG